MMKKIFYEMGGNEFQQQIIMFPYLGGSGTSVMSVANEVCDKSDVDVRVAFPPGHMGSDYEICDNFEKLINLYYEELIKILKKDSVFFGHSMGGTIAYFLAQKIIENNPELKPKKLILSAAPAPDYMKNKRLSYGEESDILEDIQKIGAIPEEMTENRELLDYFSPIFRADYMILEEAAEVAVQKIDVPSFFIMCHKDGLTSCKNILKWRNYIDSKTKFYMMPADSGHMYLEKYKEEVADRITEYLNLNLEEEYE